VVLALLLAVGACASPPPPAPDYQGIPGTRVSLVVPDGFAVSDRFFGLVGDDGASAVLITEIPGPIEAVRAGMTGEALAARGVELLRSEEVNVDGRDALLVDVRQTAGGTDLRGWILALGEADGSVMIAASTSGALADRLGATLRHTLLSARWNPVEIFEPFAGLGFTLTEAGSLKISDRLPSMISFTRGGDRGALEPDDPLLLAGSFTAPIDATDLDDFARQRLDEIAELEAQDVVSKQELTLAGLRAHELVVTARDRRSGAPIAIYQLVLVDGNRFFLVQGLVGEEHAEEFMPQFREIAHSFHRTA